MRILFTGASSFTGFWFVNSLVKAGHEVVAVFTKRDYEGLRKQRVQRVQPLCMARFGLSFGEPAFLDLIHDEGPWDCYCHHGAQVEGYRDSNFDFIGATKSNTNNLRSVLQALQDQACRRIVLTSSVFESDVGKGSGSLEAFSPYGLSKSMTYDCFRYFSFQMGLHLGRFVIPNPFGPYEEARFTHYLMKQWSRQLPAEVKTPEYVRDNIHVAVLAQYYHCFVEGDQKLCAPSGYCEPQGSFAQRLASEVQARLAWPCELACPPQQDFSEPLVRINTGEPPIPGCDEKRYWDEFTFYYEEYFRDPVG